MNSQSFNSNSNMTKINISKEVVYHLFFSYTQNEVDKYLYNISLIDIKNNLLYESEKNQDLLNSINLKDDKTLLMKIISILSYNKKESNVNYSLDKVSDENYVFKIQQKIQNHFTLTLFNVNLRVISIDKFKIYEVCSLYFNSKVQYKMQCSQKNEILRQDILLLSNKKININIEQESQRISLIENMCNLLNSKKEDIRIIKGFESKAKPYENEVESSSDGLSLNDL
jgi:hypothetical protein